LPACTTDIHPTASPPVAPIRLAELWEEPVTALIFMTWKLRLAPLGGRTFFACTPPV
jgi:hypothetical protein